MVILLGADGYSGKRPLLIQSDHPAGIIYQGVNYEHGL